MLRGYSFRPRGWALAATVVACAAFVALGNWQARRADEKRTLAARVEAPPLELSEADAAVPIAGRRLVARGRFVAEQTVLLANRLRRGRPGYEVLSPLRLAGSERHVLVNRGWIAAAPGTPPPDVRTPQGEVRLEGLALERLPQALEASAAPQAGRVRQNLDVAAFAKETGLRLASFVLEQHSPADDGLLREWRQPDFGVATHDSYAVQWYSLAVLAVALFVVLSFRRVAPR